MKTLLLGMLLVTAAAWGQVKNTENTFKLGDAPRPPATLKDVSWLVGSWTGTAFGNQFEEVWNPPSAGSMVGMFKLFDAEKGVVFYELLLLKEEAGSLSLLVKHFSPDFVAWEDKEDFVNFKLVKVEADAVHFSGLSFHRINDDEIMGYIALKQKDGQVTEHPLTYERVKP